MQSLSSTSSKFFNRRYTNVKAQVFISSLLFCLLAVTYILLHSIQLIFSIFDDILFIISFFFVCPYLYEVYLLDSLFIHLSFVILLYSTCIESPNLLLQLLIPVQCYTIFFCSRFETELLFKHVFCCPDCSPLRHVSDHHSDGL